MSLASQRVQIPLNFNLAPKSQATWDPLARIFGRRVHNQYAPLYWRNYVNNEYSIPHDKVYCLISQTKNDSDNDGASLFDNQLGSTTWDGTEEQWYDVCGSADNWGRPSLATGTRIMYPTGWSGKADSHESKHAVTTQVVWRFKAQFPTNTDYDHAGMGGSSTTNFTDASTSQYAFATRNGANWELTTRDGTTESTSTGSGGDGSWHVFKFIWDGTDIRLYVDDVLKVTKTTNLPDEPLGPFADGGAAADFNLISYSCEWE